MVQLSGETILAEDIIPNLYIQKGSTESATSVTTPQNDDDLFVTLAVGTYRVELFAHCANTLATINADIVSQWSFSGTLSSSARSAMGPGRATVNAQGDTNVAASGIVRATGHAITTAIDYGIEATSASVIHEDLLLVVSVAGVLQWKWAQFSSSATPTTVSTASRMYITTIEAV